MGRRFNPEESALFLAGASSYSHNVCKWVKRTETEVANNVRGYPTYFGYCAQARKLINGYKRAAKELEECARVIERELDKLHDGDEGARNE